MKSIKIILATLLILLFSLGLMPNKIYGDGDILLQNNNYNEILLIDNNDIDLANIPSITSTTDMSVQETTVAPTLPQPVSTGTPTLIVVHRVSNTCIVYDKYNQIVNAFIVSTGRKGHRTPLGTYKIYEHSTGNGYHLMVDGTYGKWCMRWKTGGYMFHSVCYARNGDAEPIPQEVADLGTSVSRGCVRLSVTDAEWLYRATPNGCIVKIVND
ncbi:L,D-transpeptidase [Candidatus Saccharibacteria bacterium]|nr:L,D-transpeptidase [Candidatus Saccharibacteria bacterium]